MRPTRTVALVLAGSVRATPFERFPGLAKLATHVFAATYRESARTANGMYFARPCRTLQEAAEASVVLLCDYARARQIAQSDIIWRGKTVLIVLPEAEVIAELFREQGASVALMTVLDELIPCHFFLEGDTAAITIARELLASVQADASVCVSGSRPHIEAMRLLAGPILMSILEGCDLNLRHTGLPLEAIRRVIGRVAAETLRVHQRSRARTWRAPDDAEFQRILELIRNAEPKLASHLQASEAASRDVVQPKPRKSKPSASSAANPAPDR
jgi:hypothetical protein